MVVESDMNAIWNVTNPNQGKAKKVLCVCSAGLLRSPTIASILIEQRYNARACGVESYALIPISTALIEWADTIIFVDKHHRELVEDYLKNTTASIITMPIPDRYPYRDPYLIKIIEEALEVIEV